jgi:hypothetical protein
MFFPRTEDINADAMILQLITYPLKSAVLMGYFRLQNCDGKMNCFCLPTILTR